MTGQSPDYVEGTEIQVSLPVTPWLWPYGVGATWSDSLCKEPGDVARALNAVGHCAAKKDIPSFEHSLETLSALDYERCASSGHIPTRDISHDWYNGHVWLRFPRAKWEINARHMADSRQVLIQSANGRSRLRDALTLFDESGALLLTTDESLSQALLNHDWSTLFVKDRASWHARAQVLVFGHGLLDSMHKPHKGLCAKVVPVSVPTLNLTQYDLQVLVSKVVEHIEDARNLSPLPVMGVPGWFDDSNAPGFYSDPFVYRAKPTPRITSLHERLAFIWDGSTLSSGKCVGQSLPEFQGEESPDSSEHSAG